jgi:hypothetical protein
MAKVKKSFDRELMYKKIMPTNLKKESEQSQESEEALSTNAENKDSKEIFFFQNKELNLIKDKKNEEVLYNITENLVLKKLDAALRKMNCCRCDRCKQDIVAIALNNLKPMYVVAAMDEIEQRIHNSKDIGSKVTTEVIKAVLAVRKNPRH